MYGPMMTARLLPESFLPPMLMPLGAMLLMGWGVVGLTPPLTLERTLLICAWAVVLQTQTKAKPSV